MVWNLSFQLLPGEEVLEDSTGIASTGIKPAYSVFLTNRRALFRFNGLGSSLTQSFPFTQITEIRACKRLFINYLLIKTENKDYLLNISEPDYWAGRIGEARNRYGFEGVKASPQRKKRDLLDMLTVLRKSGLLTDAELDEKIKLLDRLEI